MSNLTRIAGVPDHDVAKPGMAHFAGTGPAGKTCGDCQHRGYWPTPDKRAPGKCAQFRKLAGRDGPDVRTRYAACRYFQQKEKDK